MNANDLAGMFYILLAILLFFIGLIIYFLPAIVAYERDHHNFNAIAVLNLLTGWSFLGWVIALVWALTHVKDDKIVTHYQHTRVSDRRMFPCPQCGNQVTCLEKRCSSCNYELTTWDIPD